MNVVPDTYFEISCHCSLLERGSADRGSADQDSEELTTLTNSKSMTRSEISNESSKYKDTKSKYKDPNHLRSKIEVACE